MRQDGRERPHKRNANNQEQEVDASDDYHSVSKDDQK